MLMVLQSVVVPPCRTYMYGMGSSISSLVLSGGCWW